jgi:hypothetical protein
LIYYKLWGYLLHRVGIYHSLETRRTTTTFVQVGCRSRCRRPARRDAVATRVEATALAARVPLALLHAHVIAAARAEARPIELVAICEALACLSQPHLCIYTNAAKC